MILAQHPMAATGVAVLILLGAMGGGWLIRRLLLATLRTRHPHEFEALGQPSHRQLSSLLPRDREIQISFWRYLWEGRAFRLKDDRVSYLAGAALLADAALVAGVVLLFWSAAK